MACSSLLPKLLENLSILLKKNFLPGGSQRLLSRHTMGEEVSQCETPWLLKVVTELKER